MPKKQTFDQLRKDEGGYQAEIYLDSLGIRTWLIGRNIKDRPITDDEYLLLDDILLTGGTQEDWAEVLFDAETGIVSNELQENHGVDMRSLPWDVQEIIINMAFNMGTTRFNPEKWPKFFRAISKRNYGDAAIQMMDSKWWVQVGNRAKRLRDSLLIAREIENVEKGSVDGVGERMDPE